MTGAVMCVAGGLNATVQLDPSYAIADSTAGVTATATFTLETDGDIMSTTVTAGSVDLGDWLSNKAAAPGPFQARATLSVGDTPSGTLGSWVNLSTSPAWGLTQVAVGAKSCILTVEVGVGGVAYDSTSVQLDAERTS